MYFTDHWTRIESISENERQLVAERMIPAGTLVLELVGRETNTPSRFSVQIGSDLHLDLHEDLTDEDLKGIHRWHLLNHSCEPNVHIFGREVRALRDISAGEEICFDYAATEQNMAAPFECRCGSVSCRGTISGYAGLSTEERERIAHRAGAHLRSDGKP